MCSDAAGLGTSLPLGPNFSQRLPPPCADTLIVTSTAAMLSPPRGVPFQAQTVGSLMTFSTQRRKISTRRAAPP